MRNIMASTELPGNQYVTLSYGATIAEDIFDDSGKIIGRRVYTTKQPIVAYIQDSIKVEEKIYYTIPQKD